jgi:Cytochrome bd terminal oxidase subunit I
MSSSLANLAGFAPVDQHYLLQARQMQALSFSVHIPLVCFGISLPVMVLFAEWLYLRSGDGVYRALARRWSRVMLTLFAVGVITGTVLSFEMGLLWPNFTGTFGSVFGLGFAIEGFSFFVEAIFIGIYVYGWGRLAPRAHLLSGIPIVISGFTGATGAPAARARRAGDAGRWGAGQPVQPPDRGSLGRPTKPSIRNADRLSGGACCRPPGVRFPRTHRAQTRPAHRPPRTSP